MPARHACAAAYRSRRLTRSPLPPGDEFAELLRERRPFFRGRSFLGVRGIVPVTGRAIAHVVALVGPTASGRGWSKSPPGRETADRVGDERSGTRQDHSTSGGNATPGKFRVLTARGKGAKVESDQWPTIAIAMAEFPYA